jgi:hypothetical protein
VSLLSLTTLKIHVTAHKHRLQEEVGLEKEDQVAQAKVEKIFRFYKDLLRVLDESNGLLDKFSRLKSQKVIDIGKAKELSQNMTRNFQEQDSLIKEIVDALVKIDESNIAVAINAVEVPLYLLESFLPFLRKIIEEHKDSRIRVIVQRLKEDVESNLQNVLQRVRTRFHQLRKRNIRAVYREKASISNVTAFSFSDLAIRERRAVHDRRQTEIKAETIQENLGEASIAIQELLRENNKEPDKYISALEAFENNFKILIQYVLAEEEVASKVLEFNAMLARKLTKLTEKREATLDALGKGSSTDKQLLKSYKQGVKSTKRTIKKDGRTMAREARWAVSRFARTMGKSMAAIAILVGCLQGCDASNKAIDAIKAKAGMSQKAEKQDTIKHQLTKNEITEIEDYAQKNNLTFEDAVKKIFLTDHSMGKKELNISFRQTDCTAFLNDIRHALKQGDFSGRKNQVTVKTMGKEVTVTIKKDKDKVRVGWDNTVVTLKGGALTYHMDGDKVKFDNDDHSTTVNERRGKVLTESIEGTSVLFNAEGLQRAILMMSDIGDLIK